MTCSSPQRRYNTHFVNYSENLKSAVTIYEILSNKLPALVLPGPCGLPGFLNIPSGGKSVDQRGEWILAGRHQLDRPHTSGHCGLSADYKRQHENCDHQCADARC